MSCDDCCVSAPGSGGNNHAVEHFDRNHYPLAVKLGTITPAGADVFSYDEDDMVEDPNLPQHLAHWGINIATMSKVMMGQPLFAGLITLLLVDGQDNDGVGD